MTRRKEDLYTVIPTRIETLQETSSALPAFELKRTEMLLVVENALLLSLNSFPVLYAPSSVQSRFVIVVTYKKRPVPIWYNKTIK